jgi:hypothetical protein
VSAISRLRIITFIIAAAVTGCLLLNLIDTLSTNRNPVKDSVTPGLLDATVRKDRKQYDHCIRKHGASDLVCANDKETAEKDEQELTWAMDAEEYAYSQRAYKANSARHNAWITFARQEVAVVVALTVALILLPLVQRGVQVR